MPKKFKVTQDELDALAQPLSAYGYFGVDRGFKYRMIFLLVVATAWALRLVFFPIDVLPPTHALQGTPITDVQYLRFRAIYMIVAILIYVVSYLRDWFFPQVALIVFSFAVTGIVMDLFNFYIYYVDPVRFDAKMFLALRCVAIVCLFYNALRARRAPPMPRKLWS